MRESVMWRRYPAALQEEMCPHSGSRASASISTFQRGSSSPLITITPRRGLLPEDLAECASDCLPVPGRRGRRGCEDVLRPGPELAERFDDDREAALRLLVRIRGSVPTERCRRRRCAAVAHCPVVADRGLRRARPGRGASMGQYRAAWRRCGHRRLGRAVRRRRRRARRRRRRDARAADVELPWASVTKLLDRAGGARRARGGDGRSRRAGRAARLDAPPSPFARLRAAARRRRPMAEPGRRRIYSNTGIELAAGLLDRAGGDAVRGLLRQRRR